MVTRYMDTFTTSTSVAAAPILIAIAVVILFLRPIYVLALCDPYSDHLDDKGIDVSLPENPSRGTSAIVVFGALCLIVALVYSYGNELG